MDEQSETGPANTACSPVDFRLLFESVPGLYLVLSPEFQIVAASDAYLRATMTLREAVIGRGLFEVFPDNPNDREATGVRNLTASLNRVLINRRPDQMAIQKYDVRRPASEGGEFEERHWHCINLPIFGKNGLLCYIIHRAEDVTEIVRLRQQSSDQEQTVRQLRLHGTQMEENFKLLVEGIKDYAIFMLDPEGNVASWNLGAERIKGYRSEEIVGAHFSRFYPDAEIQQRAPERALEIALANGRFEGEGYRLRQNGSEFWANITISPVRDETGTLIGFSNITHDATEKRHSAENERRLLREEAARKAAEEHAEVISQQREQLRATMDALNQSQKMEAVGKLAGGIAHDFNNLLTVILGYCKMILAKLGPDDPLSGNLIPIAEAGERAAALTSQLLTFSRQSVLEPIVLDLNVIVRETEGLLRRLIGEDILLTTVLNPWVSRVKFDPSQLSQIILNLAINARDAMPEGGRLTIETQNADLGEECAYLHPDARPGAYVVLTMTDTGIGMTREVAARIFEPFFTTKEIGKGTGLGLAVVHGIVQQSGGFVSIYSEPGIGTCFKVYTPATMEGSTRTVPAESRGNLTGNEVILLVEDEDAVRTLASMVLKSHGYKIFAARNGLDAIQLVKECGVRIDLLLTDVVMPGMGGRDLANHLCQQDPTLKVLFCSGYTNDAVVRHGLSREEVSFLQKPYDPFALVSKVRNVLDDA